MELWNKIMLVIHVITGNLALLVGVWIILSKKGNARHKNLGLYYFICLILLSLSALFISIAKGNAFLLHIGIFVLYQGLAGYRSLRWQGKANLWEWVPALIAAINGLFMLKSMQVVLMVFGGISLLLSIQDFRLIYQSYQIKNLPYASLLKRHIGMMMGSFIGTITAFIVVNIHIQNWGIALWLGPTVILVPLMVYWQQKFVSQIKTPMTKNPILLVFMLWMLVPNALQAQNKEPLVEKVLTKTQMMEDLEALYKAIQQAHPTPFMFTSDQEYRNFIEHQRLVLPDSMTDTQFYKISRQFMAMLKCGHSNIRMSEKWRSSNSEKGLFLPFDIYYFKGKYYINNTIDTVFDFQEDDELLCIQGKRIQDIMDDLSSIQERDGLTNSYVQEIVTINFRVYYYLFYQPKDTVKIEFKTADNEVKSTQVLITDKPLKKLEKLPVLEGFSVKLKNEWSYFAIDSSRGIAYLRIRSFGSKNDYKKYYKEVFTLLNSYENMPLIIDLRYNSGGYFIHGNHFLTYVTPENFEFNFQKSKRKIEKNEVVYINPVDKLTQLAFASKPTKHKAEDMKIITFKYKKNKLYKPRKIYVLNNGITFSQATLVSAQLHQYGAIMAGGETGSTEGHTQAMLYYQVLLPHSKFKGKVAHYQVLSNSTKGEKGRGVQASIPLTMRVTAKKDEILQELVEKIQSK